MILSAIGLPVPGASISSVPLPVVERTEMMVQAVAPTTASGGSTSARGSGIGSGDGRQNEAGTRRSLRDSEPAFRRDRDRISVADRPAGPQPAFEIAVLDKLREDAMRIPTEKPAAGPREAAAPVRRPDAGEDPLANRSATPTDERSVRPTSGVAARDTTEATYTVDGRTDALAAADPTRTDPARPDAGGGDSPRVERRDAQDALEQRARDTADDGFDDARRMSGDPSPRSLDLTR